MALPYLDARRMVTGALAGRDVAREEAALEECLGRVLAADVPADRDQPPFARVTRDGFAVRAADVAALPATLRLIGEVAAGTSFGGRVGAGECVEIMTGAPLPDGADAVVMVEYSERRGGEVVLQRGVAAGENVVPRGSELAAGAPALRAGARIGPAEVAVLAGMGRALVPVFIRPRVAVIATGEELVELLETPSPVQIRDSNSYTLAAQVARAGGRPLRLRRARDDKGDVRARLERALAEADLVILSGGVSMGKYDLVEEVLGELGARFVWNGVDIRPGKPAVFGFVGEKPFFGLPGNPVSTLVTFELFARPALEMLGGIADPTLRLLSSRMARDFTMKPLPLTLFAPSALGDAGLDPLPTQGSGDVTALARSHGFAVIPPGTSRVAAGEVVSFLPR